MRKEYRMRERVRFADCDRNGRMKLSAMMSLAAELAVYDYERRGMGRDILLKQGMVFLIAGESIRIYRYPKSGEELRGATWEKMIKGARYQRESELRDENGELLVAFSTVWILVNPETRRIYRHRPAELKIVTQEDRESGALPVEWFRETGAEKPLGTDTVRYTDLDANGHLYHAAYADLVVNALPPEEADRPIRDFRISYHAEALPGETICLFREETVNGVWLFGKKEDGTRCFSCEIRAGADPGK